jgi:hypothetical protein
MGYTLTADERARYRDEGLVIPTYRLSRRLYQKARTAVEAIIPVMPADSPEFALIAHLPPREGVFGGIPGGERVFEVAIDPELVDIVAQVLGPDVVLWGSSIFAKPAGVGQRVQWHQDSYWWPIRPLVTCTVWIAIDEASPANGCLQYLPGSHEWPVLPHDDYEADGLLGQAITATLLGRTPNDVCLPAGGFSLHQANLVHGSAANPSTERRAGLVIRYMPATSHFGHEDTDHLTQETSMRTGDVTSYRQRPIFLVRGESRNPGNDFTAGHGPLADLDELLRQVRAGA